MGLGASHIPWQRQTKDFGLTSGSQYSMLILDNRGMGKSSKPLMRYSTSEMARDLVELLDHLSWTSARSLHIVGISMGGMIAQELGLLIPERVASLSLVSTAARLVNTVGFWENLRSRINMFVPKDLDQQVEYSSQLMFSQRWLWGADSLEDEDVVGRFPLNRDRFAAGEVDKRKDKEGFTRRGFLLQAIAAGWHHKSPEQLKELGDKVGRERIQVLHGDGDRMISVPHAEVLIAELGGRGEGGIGAEIVEGVGHVLPIETRGQFRRQIEGLVSKTENLR